MGITEDIAGSNIILITTSKSKYNESLGVIQPELEKAGGMVGYITINKPYNSILQDFGKKGINKNKFFFVDAITSTVQSPQPSPNCIFVSSPTALTDLGLAFSSLFSEKKCDAVFFDAISTLGVYQDPGSVIKFVHNLITKARVLNKKAIFLALKEDSETLIKDLNMFVDRIIEL